MAKYQPASEWTAVISKLESMLFSTVVKTFLICYIPAQNLTKVNDKKEISYQFRLNGRRLLLQ